MERHRLDPTDDSRSGDSTPTPQHWWRRRPIERRMAAELQLIADHRLAARES